MKINITKKEYEKLLDILYIADWVLHAHIIGDRTETKEYKDLEQKFLSHAKDFGMEDFVVWDQKMRKYYPAREFEDNPATKIIEEFENDTFWDELTERLAIRDLVREYGEEEVQKMEFMERYKKKEVYTEKYSIEFEKNGLNNVKISFEGN